MDNDYTQTVEDCEHAAHVTETAYCNAVDEDIQALLGEAQRKIEHAQKLAKSRE